MATSTCQPEQIQKCFDCVGYYGLIGCLRVSKLIGPRCTAFWLRLHRAPLRLHRIVSGCTAFCQAAPHCLRLHQIRLRLHRIRLNLHHIVSGSTAFGSGYAAVIMYRITSTLFTDCVTPVLPWVVMPVRLR